MRRDVLAGRGQAGAAPARVVLGLLAIALGVLFLGANLGYFDAREAFRVFWPAAFVVLGLVILFEPRARGGRRLWGLVWIVAGGWIWAYQREWIDVDFWDLFFPGILVLFGASLVLRSLRGPRRERAAADDPEAEVRTFAVMSGNEVRSTSAGFRSADLGAFMGGVTLDLTQAKLAGEEAEIDVFAMWGAVEIRVPREWTVASKVVPLMAGFEDKTEPRAGGPVRRLVVRGFVVMGGVEVKN